MFGLFKKTPKPDFSEIRELLFGDVPLADWKPRGVEKQPQEPWLSFEAARGALAGNDVEGAVAALRRIVGTPNHESRQYLQAWHALRQLGAEPQSEPDPTRVLGVVLEVHLEAGLDTLAGYADGTARYINHGGKLVVLEAPDPSFTGPIGALVQAGQRVANVIGPSQEARGAPPPKGNVRINLLTAFGRHFGEGPLDALSADALGGPVIAAGTRVMMSLIARVKARKH